MQKSSLKARRHEDLAIAHGFARSVYESRQLLGLVHQTERGFVAETVDGDSLGLFSTSIKAAHAIVSNAVRAA